MRGHLRVLLLLSLVLPGLACGGEGLIASPTPIRDRCPSEDTYLAGFYQLIDTGQLSNIEAAVHDELSYDLRSDLVLAIVHLVGALPDGTFEELQKVNKADTEGELGPKLAIVIRWIAKTGPHAPYEAQFATLRRILSTCEGGSVLQLLADLVGDKELRDAVFELVDSVDLAEILSGFEFEDAKGRAALKALLRNLLVTLQSPDFDVNALLDLIGLLVDLDSGSGSQFSQVLSDFFSPGEKREALTELFACLQATDPDLALGDLIYDLLTDDALSITQLFDGGEITLSEPAWTALSGVLELLGEDAYVRRVLASVLVLLLNEDHVVGVLSDMAHAMDANIVGDLVDLAAAFATKECE